MSQEIEIAISLTPIAPNKSLGATYAFNQSPLSPASRPFMGPIVKGSSGSEPDQLIGLILIERLEDLGLELAFQRLGGDRSHQLEGELAVAPDDERLGHAIDAPVDAGAIVRIETHLGVRVAVRAEETADVLGRVALRDPIDGDALRLELRVGGERHQIAMLVMAGLAPGAEHVDDAHMAGAQVGVGQASPAVEAGQVERRRRLPDQDRGNACRIAGPQPLEQKPGQRHEDDERNVDQPAPRTMDRGFGFGAHWRLPFAPSSAWVARASSAFRRRESRTTQAIIAPIVSAATA